MAKRFTDTSKYKKPFIRSLKAPYKLLWDYLYHDCDHAGIWIVDFDIAQVYVGLDASISKQEAIKNFNSDEVRVIEFDEGKKWFIPSFIEFQYGELNSNNRAHQSVIRNLEKHNLLDFLKKENKPLKSPLQGDMDKDKEKELDKEKEKRKRKTPEKKIIEVMLPWDTQTFKAQWDHWKIFKAKEFGFKYKSAQSEQAALTELSNKANGNEKTAIAIIHQSMANGWKGFFELKNNNGNRNHNQTRTDAQLKEAASNAVDRMFGQQ